MSRAGIRNLVVVLITLIVLVVLFFLLRPDSLTPESGDVGETQEETIIVAINEGVMSPAEVTVYEGDRVNLQITSDSPVAFHLHGYELEEEVEPGEPADMVFDATSTGRFQIEDHHTDTVLGVLIVQPR